MALKTFVKVSAVNNLSDARYCAGMEVDLIGFPMDPLQNDYVTPETYAAITEWLEGIDYAGEFSLSDPENVIKSAEQYRIDYLQVENPGQIASITKTGLPLILKVNLDKVRDIAELDRIFSQNQAGVEFFLVEEEESRANDELLEDILQLARRYPVVLGAGITPGNVHYLATETDLTGISLKGGDEIKPGLKDFEEMADILEALEIDDTKE